MRDWQIHSELLHQHDNKKFARFTKRVLYDAPVIEAFDETQKIADVVILVASAAVLGVFAVLGVLCR